MNRYGSNFCLPFRFVWVCLCFYIHLRKMTKRIRLWNEYTTGLRADWEESGGKKFEWNSTQWYHVGPVIKENLTIIPVPVYRLKSYTIIMRKRRIGKIMPKKTFPRITSISLKIVLPMISVLCDKFQRKIHWKWITVIERAIQLRFNNTGKKIKIKVL